jgi:non-ribosomal peptide synthetase component E (peptide arylation enzyme)
MMTGMSICITSRDEDAPSICVCSVFFVILFFALLRLSVTPLLHTNSSSSSLISPVAFFLFSAMGDRRCAFLDVL